MNKHTRLIVSLLFIGFIVLAAAITRFYSNSEKISVSSGSQTVIAKKMAIDGAENRIFQASDGSIGIIDSSERVIVSPEWKSIRFTNGEMCIASKDIHGKELFGCIDYEGNITVPFVYSDISPVSGANQMFYIARTSDNKKSVVYDNDFTPCFSRAWDTCEYSAGRLSASSENGDYTYLVKSDGFALSTASVKGSVLDHSYTLTASGYQGLTAPMIEKMDSATRKYIEYAYKGNSDVLSDIDKTDDAVFLTIFPEEHNITSKRLTDITSATIKHKTSAEGVSYYSVIISATTSIVYKNQEGKTKRLRDDYTASVEFTGSSANDLKAVKGSFLKDKPDYPAPEPQQETTAQQS